MKLSFLSALAARIWNRFSIFRERLAAQGLGLVLTEAAVEFLGNQGYDPTYGAKPLKRAIQHHLLDPLSLAVLEGKSSEGVTITADLQDGQLNL